MSLQLLDFGNDEPSESPLSEGETVTDNRARLCPAPAQLPLLPTAVESPERASTTIEAEVATVEVIGAVKQPGRLRLSRPTRIIDALVAAGGLSPAAIGVIELRRLDTGTERRARPQLCLRATLDITGVLAWCLRDGDILSVLPVEALKPADSASPDPLER